MRCTSCGIILNPETMECPGCERKPDNDGESPGQGSMGNHIVTAIFVVIVAAIGALIYGTIFGATYAVIGAGIGAAIVIFVTIVKVEPSLESHQWVRRLLDTLEK